jgi:hypothetical protein
MKLRFALPAILLVWLATASYVAAEPAVVGSIKTAEGACFVIRGSATLPTSAGERLYLGDTLLTGADGTLGAILRDDTVLSLGPDTEIRVEEFVFEPASGQLGMVLKMLRGVASYISGQIAKLAPDAVRFETPIATVGVRGTRFLARVVPE